MMKFMISSASVCALFAMTAFAQEEATDNSGQEQIAQLVERSENADAFSFAYGVPDNAALTLSGLEASSVTTVNQLQDFIVTVPNFSSGETAIGLDFKLTALGRSQSDFVNTAANYANLKRHQRVLGRTRLSMVARSGLADDDAEKAKASILALGFSTSLLDGSDPLLNEHSESKACNAAFAALNKRADTDRYPDLIDDVRRKLVMAHGAAVRLQISTSDTLPERILKADAVLDMLDEVQANLVLFKQSSEERTKVVELDETIEAYVENLRSILSDTDQSENAEREINALAGQINKYHDVVSNNAIYVNREAVITAKDLLRTAACKKDIEKTLKSKPNWDVGGGALWQGAKEDGFEDVESGGYAIWTSVRVPLFNRDGEKDSYWVLGGTARWGFDEIVSTGDETTPDGEAETVSVWGGLEYFSEKWRAGARYGWVETDYNDAALDTFSSDGERWLINADYNIAPNIWLSATYGEADGTVDALRGEQLSVGLKFSSPTALNFFE